jgi:hypothetical protein
MQITPLSPTPTPYRSSKLTMVPHEGSDPDDASGTPPNAAHALLPKRPLESALQLGPRKKPSVFHSTTSPSHTHRKGRSDATVTPLFTMVGTLVEPFMPCVVFTHSS